MQWTKITKLMALGMACASTTACHSGGDVTASANQSLSPIYVEAPTIAVPAQQTYFSNQSVLQVSGLCNTGYTVRLSEDIVHEQICENSQYTFNITKMADGFYPIALTQFHPQFGLSRQNTFIWIKKTSVTMPTITQPSQDPFFSGNQTLTVGGGCETGATVSLSGGATGSTVCQSSTYLITVTKNTDGAFAIQVNQQDPAGNTASTQFTWQRHALTVSPANPQLVAGEVTVFNPAGGSLTYDSELITNNSGATYDPVTRSYTAGAVSGVTDTIQFEDSLGLTVLVPIQVLSGLADHLELPTPSGDGQFTAVGQITTEPIRIQVVDAYGNRVPNIPLVFSVKGGDARIVGSPAQTTNSQGLAQVFVRMGYGAPRSVISVKPASGTLPDVNSTGNTSLAFNLYATTTNSGVLGNSFTVTSNPNVAEIGDFNGDGRADLAVLNSGDPSIGLLFGRANGLFDAQVRINGICNAGTGMIVRDFNADNRLDFAVVCAGESRISIVLSSGVSDFAPVTHINSEPTETLPVAITSADLNNDTRPDLITLSAASTVASVRFGNANGTFQTHTEFAVGPGPSQAITGDFNQDGRPDLALINAGDSSVGILINNSMGGFLAHYSFPVGAGPAGLRVADFNGDGFDDIAVINNLDNNLMILLNDQFGGFAAPITTPTSMGPFALTVTDLDKDGVPDVLVANLDATSLSTFIGNGDGTFTAAPERETMSNPVYVAAGDLNGDTLPDVAVTSNGEQKIQIFIGKGSPSVGLEFATDANPRAVRLADMNNDGFQDMIVASQGANNTTIYGGNGLGLWTAIRIIANGNGPSALTVADFNGDGNRDLAIIHQNLASLRIFLGDGTGQFAAPQILTTGLQPAEIVAQDLNNDGLIDLAVTNASSNTVSLFQNQGAGVFAAKLDVATGAQPFGIAIADLNDDQEMDLIVTNQSPGSVSIILSSGGLTFQPQIEISAGTGCSSVVPGYMNGDSHVDLAVLNEPDSSVSVLLGLGNGSFQPAANFTITSPASQMLSGDFDGNGRLDLAMVNSGTQNISLFYGSGNGMFNTTGTFAVFHAASLFAIGDYNNDAAVDFVTVDPNTQLLKVWPGD